MPNDFASQLPSSKSPTAVDYRSRQFALELPQSLLGRLGLVLQVRLESLVARKSRLPDSPVYDPEDFPWVPRIQSQWRTIRAELDEVMVYRDRMPSFHEILKEASTITQDADWKTFFLVSAGRECHGNARRCPRTMALLREIPDLGNAFFSILSPGKHIPPHRGAYNGVLRYHLGLLVPEPRERCRIRIADGFYSWSEGESLIFDDSFNHEVWNDTDGYRVVLFVDFARPLRQPWHWLNRRLLDVVLQAPFLREATAKQKRWEQMFYAEQAQADRAGESAPDGKVR